MLMRLAILQVAALIGIIGVQSIAKAEFKYNDVRTPKDPDQFECLLLGDTYFGEMYQKKRERNFDPFLDLATDADYDYSAQNLRAMLDDSDLNIANLETAITNKVSSPLSALGKEYLHKGHIVRTPNALKRHGIDVVSLANNHSLDYGIEGMNQTKERLRRVGIQHFGSGDNRSKALHPYLFKVPMSGGREFKVALIGALQERETYNSQGFDFYAGESRPGVAALDEDRIQNLVKKLREFDRDIFIILFLHWGRDYEKITAKQQALAERWQEMGINAVIGHGPHAIQPVEIRGDQLLAYSIGNFIFNSTGRYATKHANAYSLITRLIKPSDSDNVYFRFYPTFIDNTVVHFAPRLIGPAELPEVVETLGLSQEARKSLGRDKHGWFIEVKIPERRQ